MEELIKLVSQKAGIPDDKAKLAIQTVLDFLTDKLPAPIAGQIKSFLGGSRNPEPVGDVAENLGGLFGLK